METKRYSDFVTDLSKPSFRFQASPAEYAQWRRQAGALSGNDDLESVMRCAAALLSDGGDSWRLQRAALQKALDWLETLRQRLERASRTYGAIQLTYVDARLSNSDGKPIPGTERTEVYAWNEGSLDGDTAGALITSGAAEFCDQIVMMTPAQARYLFPGHDEQKGGEPDNG